MKDMVFDRKSFLKGSAAVGATIVSSALTGCLSNTETVIAPPSTTKSDGSIPEDASANPSAQTATYSPSFDFENHTVTLNNGVPMPVLGIGTYILSNAQAEESVYTALMAGTRLIDTARIYGNEEGVGRGIARSGIPRGEIFLTTKLWTDDFSNAASAIDASLTRLKQDYVDLLLLHHESTDDENAYRAMEDAVVAGKVRCIGISNFYESGFVRMRNMASIPPAILQNETQPYFQEHAIKNVIADAGTILESWFPLCGKDGCQTLFADSTIAEIARNHNVSPAQIVIRWHLQSGNICIPGSSNPDHIREDANVFDFELAQNEMDAINALDRNQRFASY